MREENLNKSQSGHSNNKNNVDTEVHSLPPRSKVHGDKPNKNKWRLKYPIIRLLVLFFILLPIVIYSVYTYREGSNGDVEKTQGEQKSGYEMINLEKEESVESDVQEDSEISDDSNKKNETEEQADPETNEQVSNTSEGQESETANNNDSKTSTEHSNPVTQQENETSKEQIIYHTVQENETLYRIAMKYYKSKTGIEIIKDANGIKDNEIQAGQVLKIPIKQ